MVMTIVVSSDEIFSLVDSERVVETLQWVVFGANRYGRFRMTVDRRTRRGRCSRRALLESIVANSWGPRIRRAWMAIQLFRLGI